MTQQAFAPFGARGIPARGTAESDTYDLAFVGAGASTAYVLISLLTSLADTPPAAPLRIGVVERAPDAFSGIAYGGRAARTALLITPLRDFLPPGELRLFTDWLAENKRWAFGEFLAAEGPVSARWWVRHRAAVESNAFDDLFLPRYIFGDYLVRRTRRAIAAAADAGLATTEVIQDDVRSIEGGRPDYLLRCRDRVLRAGRVVLATGSSPVRPRLPAGEVEGGAVLLDSPFEGMDAALDRIERLVTRRAAGQEPPHILLIGGNASTMDMLYQVADIPVVAARRARFTVLSPRGELPELMDRPRPGSAFRAELLQALADQESVRAAAVYEAAVGDLARGRDAGYSVADTLKPISDGVVAVLPRLSSEEALEFAGHWGVELGRHQRRAGWEYCEVVDELVAQGRLTAVAGSFVGLGDADGRGVRVRFDRDGVAHELDRPADVVINCGGPAPTLQDTAPSLVADLISSGVCRATPYGGGIAVDASLSAAPGFFVMGPLLAGNVINGSPVWHMEHCGRISAFGSSLGPRLARSLATEPLPAG
ncbi:FAD/NAD(P)-binding protein [Blastococcus mobilis]|nr:FAD/NAD(P)-binding protein [Blastococcus mobilis]